MIYYCEDCGGEMKEVNVGCADCDPILWCPRCELEAAGADTAELWGK